MLFSSSFSKVFYFSLVDPLGDSYWSLQLGRLWAVDCLDGAVVYCCFWAPSCHSPLSSMGRGLWGLG